MQPENYRVRMAYDKLKQQHVITSCLILVILQDSIKKNNIYPKLKLGKPLCLTMTHKVVTAQRAYDKNDVVLTSM